MIFRNIKVKQTQCIVLFGWLLLTLGAVRGSEWAGVTGGEAIARYPSENPRQPEKMFGDGEYGAVRFNPQKWVGQSGLRGKRRSNAIPDRPSLQDLTKRRGDNESQTRYFGNW